MQTQSSKMVAWALVESILPFLLTFCFSIVLARLLEPEVYGLVAMLAIFLALGGVVQNMGFAAALVQRETLAPDDTTTVFVMNVILGAALALSLCFAAPAIAAFYGRSELVELVYAHAVILVIMTFGMIQSVMLQREFRFRTGSIIETSSSAVAGFAAIAAALWGLGVWSLVILSLVREICRTGMLWALVRWRPEGRFSMLSLKSLWPYSRHMVGASLYHHFATNLGSVLVGKYFSATTLGLYARAQSLQLLPNTLIGTAVRRVAFPVYCRRSGDAAGLLSTLRMHTRLMAVAAGYLTAAFMANSREIVLILVGEAWEASAAMLKIISAAIFLNSLFPLHSEMNKAIGHSRYFLAMEVTKKSIQVAAIVIGLWFGITGLLWALVLTSVTDYVISASSSVKYLGYTWKDQGRDIVPSAFVTVAAVLLAALVDVHLGVYSSVLALLIKGSLVTAVFVFAILVFYKAFPEVIEKLRTAVRDHALRVS